MPETDFDIRPLGKGNLSVEITSLQASEATRAEVQSLMVLPARRGVCLRDQELAPAQYVAFAKLFGELRASD